MKLHYIQHVPFETPAAILDWAQRCQIDISSTHLYTDDSRLPAPEALEGLVVMGGPMGVDDEDVYPWLRDEKTLIEQTICAGKPVLGICLGAQLIAQVCGARVYRGEHQEIGWYHIERDQRLSGGIGGCFPRSWQAFHWHGDTFDIPENACRIGGSEACLNQGFLMDGHVLALQFHLEVLPDGVKELATSCASELVPGPFVQKPPELYGHAEDYKNTCRIMYALLDELFAV